MNHPVAKQEPVDVLSELATVGVSYWAAMSFALHYSPPPLEF